MHIYISDFYLLKCTEKKLPKFSFSYVYLCNCKQNYIRPSFKAKLKIVPYFFCLLCSKTKFAFDSKAFESVLEA